MKITIGVFVVLLLWTLWGYFSSRVEQAEYTVIKNTDAYEIRHYPAHIVAQTTVQGSYSESMNSGFRIVAGYIFGDNTRNESIAMTAPVQQGTDASVSENIAMTAPVVARTEGASRVISFGMPKKYTLATLPTPSDPRVKLVEIPDKNIAVLRFSWFRTNERIAKKEAELKKALAIEGIRTIGDPSYAGYNAPWTPPWMTRNEVHIEVVYP